MLAAGKWVLTIVGGGTALGSLLAMYANPVMKPAPEAPWSLTGQPQFAVSDGYHYPEAGPEDLSPYGGYRPDLDYDAEVTSYWSDDDYEGYSYAYYNEAPAMPEPEPAFVQLAAAAPVEAVDAAVEAEAAAEEAAEAAPAAEAVPAEAPAGPQLAGLY